LRRISPLFSVSLWLFSFVLTTPSAFAQWGDDGEDDIGDDDGDDDIGDEGDEGDGDGDEGDGDSDSDDGAEPNEPNKDESAEDEGAAPEADDCSGDDCPKADGEKSSDSAETSEDAPAPETDEPKESVNSDEENDAKAERRARRREKKLNSGMKVESGVETPAQSGPPARAADEAANDEAVEAAMVDLPAPGPSLTPLTITTSSFARLEIREGYDALGVETPRRREGDAVFYRARLGIETNPLPVFDGSDVRVKLSPQASGMWGESPDTFTTAELGLYEGYLQFRSKRLDTSLGRQRVEYGEGIVFGEVWHQSGRAFDGLTFRYKMNKGYVDFLGLQTAEAHPAGAERLFGGDEYIWGVYSGFGGYLGDDIETDAYVIAKSAVAQDGAPDPASGGLVDAEGGTLFTVGARVKHRVEWLDYRFEAGIQFGEAARSYRADPATLESPSAFAYQGSGELGFSFGSATRISFGGDFASGDDLTTRGKEGWDPLFSTSWLWLGNMGVIGTRTNIMTGNLKLTRGITESLTLDIDGHVFARPEFGGLGQVGRENLAGMEIDTRLQQKLGKHAWTRGTYGLFIPQSGHYASDDLASYGEVEVRVEF
jgi:hypothetical protein